MISSLGKIENPPDDPMELFEEYLKEGSENDIQGLPTTFNLASSSKNGDVSGRTLVLRGHDKNGLTFITERNSYKYKIIKDNPKVSATFLWIYHIKDDHSPIKHQVRIDGIAEELESHLIKEYYESEPISYKIRSKICECGKPVDWNELSKKHDKVLKDVLDGKEKLEQTDTYTAIKIKPNKFDFYHSKGPDQTADRVVYYKESKYDKIWKHQHVYA